MVSGSLALLHFLLGFHGGRQGSGPNRGQSPVEWGDFLFVRPSVRTSVCSPLRLQTWLTGVQAWLAGPQAWLAGPQAQLAGPQAWLDGPEGGDVRTYVQTNGKSPHSTGLRPLLRPLPKRQRSMQIKVKQGKGTADHLIPWVNWFFLFQFLLICGLRLKPMVYRRIKT